MIKTDLQKDRTLENIERFKEQLKHVQSLDDPIEKELASASYEGMISQLHLEVERYESAKRGIVQMPRSIQNLTDLCPYITDLRLALGWTQEMLGDQLGCSRQRINQMEEHEYRSITVEQLQTILEILGVITTTRVTHNTIHLVERSGTSAVAYA